MEIPVSRDLLDSRDLEVRPVSPDSLETVERKDNKDSLATRVCFSSFLRLLCKVSNTSFYRVSTDGLGEEKAVRMVIEGDVQRDMSVAT